MFLGPASQGIRALESIWPFDRHFPIFTLARTHNCDMPLPGSITKQVLNDRNYFGTGAEVTGVLHFNSYRHQTVIVQRSATRIGAMRACRQFKIFRLVRMMGFCRVKTCAKERSTRITAVDACDLVQTDAGA